MKTQFYFLALLMISACFISCNDDDESDTKPVPSQECTYLRARVATTWTYINPDGGEFTNEGVADTIVDGRTMLITESRGAQEGRSTIGCIENGLAISAPSSTGLSDFEIGEDLALDFQLDRTVGETWNAETIEAEFVGQAILIDLVFEMKGKKLNLDVNGTSYTDVVQIGVEVMTMGFLDGTIAKGDYYLAPEVGLIRSDLSTLNILTQELESEGPTDLVSYTF